MRDIIKAIISDDHFLKCQTYSLARNGEGLTPCFLISIPVGLYDYWAYIDFKKPNGERFKTPRIDVDNGEITYNIPLSVLDAEGQLEVQVVFQNADGEIWKTYVKEFAVRYSINATDDIPDKQDFIAEAQKLLDEAVNTAKSVEERANNGEFDGKNAVIDQIYNPESENAQSGIAVAEAITLFDKSKQKNFEHIATIKVSPDENGDLPTWITFSADSDGNAFELTDFCLTMKLGATDGNNARVALQVNGLNVFGNANIYLSATGLAAWYINYIDLGAGKLCIAPTQAAGTILVPNINLNTFKGGVIPAVTPNGYNYELITKIQFYIIGGTAKTFIEGSEFKLYGVRK